MVKEIHDFAVKKIEGDDHPQSDLLWRGTSIGLHVDGIALEKQWQTDVGYLLFLTEDSPYEEGLHIYL